MRGNSGEFGNLKRIDSAPQTTDLDQVVLELSGFRVTRPTPLIGHGDDLNGRFGDAVDHGVGKTPKKKFSRAVQIPRPAFGELRISRTA